MKEIFQGLIAMQLQTTWQEIYEFRETHTGKIYLFLLILLNQLDKINFYITGNVVQAIKAMAYAIERRRHRKEKQYGKYSP